MHYCRGVRQVPQGQTKRRKKPALMRFLHGVDNFHEKITFGFRFVHACCIHRCIVDNGTGRKQVFRDGKQQRFNAFQGRVKTLRREVPTPTSMLLNSIEVVSPVTSGL
jgi:hypothetical protein